MAGVEPPPDSDQGSELWPPIYEYKSNNEPMASAIGLGLPILPPPKRFLLEGSVLHVSPDTIYRFHRKCRDRRPEHKDAVDVTSYKVRIHDDKIQLIRASWFFKRDVNVMAERKVGFHMLTYSAKTKGLYHIRNWPTGNKRYHKRVRRISLNKFHVELDAYDSNQVKRWFEALRAMVKKDVPDVCDESANMRTGVIKLILQHRVGKAIQGLDETFIENLGHLVSDNHHRNALHDEVQYEMGIDQALVEADVRKRKRATVYKFIPTLQKTGSVNKAMKALLGKHYNRILVKLIYSFPLYNACRGREDKFISKYKNEIPNGIKHLLAKGFKDHNYDDVESLLVGMGRMLNDLEYDRTISHDVVANWAKVMVKLETVVDWTIWKDIYSMSAQLGLRVRPTRFTSVRDIRNLHDEYSRLIGATSNNSVGNLPKSLLTFLEIGTPEEIGDYAIHQITSQIDLDVEGDLMSHCVASYGHKCMNGSSVIISIRNKENKRRMFTVEFSGRDFTLIQAQGYNNEIPDRELDDTLFNSLTNALRNAESKKPLSYQMRANFKFKQLSIMRGLDTIEDLTIDEEVIEKQLEMVNCRLERLIQINTLIDSPNPPSNQELVELASKIDIEAVDNLLYQHRPRRHLPRPRAGVPAPLDAGLACNDLNLDGNDLFGPNPGV